ncbi:MAG: tetratricopeptide repeat protein [Persicimonas sp.]
MKVLLEILDDASQLLAALDSIEEMRPETRKKLKVLLESLCSESTRLLRSEAVEISGDEAPADGERFERRCREWLLQRSLEALAEGDYEQAAHYLEQGAEAFPDDVEILNHLGLVRWEEGQYDRAAEAYRDAMSAAFPTGVHGEVDWRDGSNEAYLRAMEGRALSLCEIGEYDDALELFDALAKMNAIDFAGCRYMAGELRHKRGELEAAIEDYRLGPTEPATLYNLALAYFEYGDREASARTFIRAFISNIHVAGLLAGRREVEQSCVPGYLGSRDYAENFATACRDLWADKHDAIEFMETCLDHPLVISYVEECREEGGDAMLERQPVGDAQGNWLRALTDETSVDGLAHTIVNGRK